jgi:hypothetical protein
MVGGRQVLEYISYSELFLNVLNVKEQRFAKKGLGLVRASHCYIYIIYNILINKKSAFIVKCSNILMFYEITKLSGLFFSKLVQTRL